MRETDARRHCKLQPVGQHSGDLDQMRPAAIGGDDSLRHPIEGAVGRVDEDREVTRIDRCRCRACQMPERQDPVVERSGPAEFGRLGKTRGIEKMREGQRGPRRGAERNALFGGLGHQDVGRPFEHFRERHLRREWPEPVRHRDLPGCDGSR